MSKDLTHRSFTVRVPLDLYVEMSELAREGGQHLNQKVNDLLKLGLGESINLNAQIERFIRKMDDSKETESE